MSPASAINLLLRVLMECSVVGGLSYWGVRTGDTAGMKVLLGVGAPVVGFGAWGALDFRDAGRHAEKLRLLEELATSGLAAAALYDAGQQALGAALAGLSVIYHALVYLSGERLLKRDMVTSASTALEQTDHDSGR